MNGWVSKDQKNDNVSTVGASQTDSVISKENFSITARGALNFVVHVKTSSTTVAAGITAKLQTRTNTQHAWQDSKTVSVTGNGSFFIKLQTNASGDQSFLPLLAAGRVVISTGVGDTVDIDAVEILQEL